MTGRTSRRRRWVASVVMGLVAAGGTVAQVSSSGALPSDPASSIPIIVPVPDLTVAVPPIAASLPPLVVTPPTPPPPPAVKREVAPPPCLAKVDLPRVEPLKIEAPRIGVPAIEPPKIEAPKIDLPPAKTVIVPATTVSIVKPMKPAIAEIISAGPKAVDASDAFSTALLDAKAAYSKVRDYSGHMLLQERLKGELQAEQTVELRVRAQPKSVAVKFIAPTSMVGRELIFADGRNANKARVKAAGTYGPLAFASLPVSDTKSAVNARHTLADVGLGPVLERIDRALATEAKLRNPITITGADYTFAGKTVTRYEISFDRPHALRDAARYVVCIDPDTKLPVRLEVYDPPTAGKFEGEMREAMSFVNLTFNQVPRRRAVREVIWFILAIR